MTNTLARSRRLIAALESKGFRVSDACRAEAFCSVHFDDGSGKCNSECICSTRHNAPDLTQPENLHHLFAVADVVADKDRLGVDSLRRLPANERLPEQHQAVVCGFRCAAPTRSLAIIAALEKAAGIKEENDNG
jgi:hypothetical protein